MCIRDSHYTGTDRTECRAAYIYSYRFEWLYHNGRCNDHRACSTECDVHTNQCAAYLQIYSHSNDHTSRQHTNLYHYTGTDRTECRAAYIYSYRFEWLYHNGRCNDHRACSTECDVHTNQCAV